MTIGLDRFTYSKYWCVLMVLAALTGIPQAAAQAPLATPSAGEATDSETRDGGDDHGGARSSATRLALPSVTEGRIDPGDDVDYFRFEVAETSLVNIATTGGLDTVGSLEDGEGGELASDDDSGSLNNFRIQRSLSAGPYYVRVGSFGSSTGDYILRLTTLENPDAPVEIADPALRQAVEETLGKAPHDPITRGEMATLSDLESRGVRKLTGIEYAINLSSLTLRYGEISNLAPLAGLTSLTWLDLAENAIVELGPLADMTLTALETLSLNGNEIADVTPLARLTSLTRLYLANNEISDVSPLAEMTLLTTLVLPNNAIVDVTPLAGMRSLTWLNLEGWAWAGGCAVGGPPLNEITDLSPLAGLTSLRVLFLGGNGITDVTPLAGLTSLRLLGLRFNAITDASPLAGLTSLTRLDLAGNPIMDMSPLARMTWLTELGLSCSAIVDLEPLAGLTLLTTLSLVNNEIADVSPLAGLTSLTWLSLRNNGVFDLEPLAGMAALTNLDLVGNKIVDVSPLSGLRSLTSLNLSANAILDAAPIVANEGLGHGDSVDLTFNPLGPESRETHIPQLLERGVEVQFDEVGEFDLPEIPDIGLRQAVEKALIGLFEHDYAMLDRLDGSSRGIEDLTGLHRATSLRGLFLDRNKITDIAPLAGLNSLHSLTLAHNMVEDWAPLAGMDSLRYLALDGNSLSELPPLPPSLYYLYLTRNSVSDISAMADLWLFELQLDGNSVTSLAPLAGMNGLRYLHVNDNDVGDLSALNFASLRELLLRGNALRDISPLLNGGELLMVDVRRNPLSDDALGVLETLRERRVTVLAGETVPYFPAAGDSRQGFVRIVNRSDADGHVFIEAVDDAGLRAGPLRMDVGGRQAAHFNSTDLEYGSAAKGLSGGVGSPTAGDWRLEVISSLDVEVLSYIRTEDGFVTAMHDVAADAMAPFFNPGSNENQRSILRVVNTEAEPAKWITGGYDDRGIWHPMTGSLLVRPQHALTLTAQALENTHGLGDGDGKWRLRVRGFPWFAMSLLESPTGHLTNLSTAPDNATTLEDGGTLHRLPLFPAAGGARQGFVRVINRSYFSGEVAIEAVDDAGNRSGPVRLQLRPRRVAHFNSADLEGGNAAKGLDGGVGIGAGDWRLEVASELELMVLAYARTADGFLTSLHDLAPVAEDGSHRVVFFNPGDNTRQVSKLRLINNGDEAASVTVTGIDDRGRDSGTVTLAVPAGSAYTYTSAELEAGADGLAGRLGDGGGKWRLRVRSDAPISVMSLLETPSGHLTNVSTGTAD